jgi:glycosyltransferase involved in cell wall biosynthesis
MDTEGRLTIAVDARELTGRPTGVGRYLLELLDRWSARPDARRRRIIMYTHAPLAAPTPVGAEVRQLPGTGGTLWEQVTFALALGREPHDVLFAPAYTAPIRTHVPLALTIHDLSYAAHPEWFPWREGARRRLITRHAARRADVVLTVSAFSAGEIVERLGIPPSKVRVIYHGVTAAGGVGGQEAPASSLPSGQPWHEALASSHHREPLVLFVGSIFNRRRIPDLLHAFSHIAPRIPGARLVIVGDNRTYPREDHQALAVALDIQDRVEIRAYASDEDIARLLRRAAVFVFVSEYEGFGLPPLEALAAGVPIVVADADLSHEIYGDAAVTVPPGDAHALAAAIHTLLTHPMRRQSLLARAPAVLERYSWDRAADETLEAIERAASTPQSAIRSPQ